ncbi:MAG TPA: hypothetical protein VHX44_05095 [Planctomycetota bacterium]|nr:hypothetical protein [Planctomycetota bacterium]
MILPNPDPWFSRRTCHHLALAAAVSETTTLLERPRRTASEDLDLLRVARCACECASLIDPLDGPADQRVRAGLLLANALLATGRHFEAADEARRLHRLARSLPWASAAAAQAALVGIAAWTALGRDNHADHLRTLARSLIETLTDERQRARLTRILNGTTGDSPSQSERYCPHPALPHPTSANDHAE